MDDDVVFNFLRIRKAYTAAVDLFNLMQRLMKHTRRCFHYVDVYRPLHSWEYID
jgi:hypothetical protein